MDKKLILLIGFVLVALISVPSAISTCTCTTQNSIYIQGGTVTASCICDSVLEKNKDYTIAWRNTTNAIIQTDAGTTPPAENTYFYKSYIIPTDETEFGIYNITLVVNTIFKDYHEFNISNGTVPYSDRLFFLEVEFSENMTLGEIGGGIARIYNPIWGYIEDAECYIVIHSPKGTPIHIFESETDGRGHIQGYSYSDEWSKASGTGGDLVDKQITWHVSCMCHPDCESSKSGTGCCLSENGTLVTDYLVGENEFLTEIIADRTPLGEFQTLSLTGYMMIYFAIIFFIGHTWKATLFTRQKEPTSLIRVLFTWIGLWLLVFMNAVINVMLKDAFANPNYINLFEVLYVANIIINILISAYLLVFFIFKALLFLGIDVVKIMNKKRGGNI